MTFFLAAAAPLRKDKMGFCLTCSIRRPTVKANRLATGDADASIQMGEQQTRRSAEIAADIERMLMEFGFSIVTSVFGVWCSRCGLFDDRLIDGLMDGDDYLIDWLLISFFP